MVGQFGADPERVLDEKIATNPSLKEAGITAYENWRDICQEKTSRKGTVASNLDSALHAQPNQKLTDLAKCAEELDGFCQWGIAMATAEKDIVDIRGEIGITNVAREELFAPSGNDALQFGMSTMVGLLGGVVGHLLSDLSPEAQKQFNEEQLRPLIGQGATPGAYVKLLEGMGRNPGQYGLSADFQLPDSVRQIMEVARKIDSYA
jgi:hypothetical protein